MFVVEETLTKAAWFGGDGNTYLLVWPILGEELTKDDYMELVLEQDKDSTGNVLFEFQKYSKQSFYKNFGMVLNQEHTFLIARLFTKDNQSGKFIPVEIVENEDKVKVCLVPVGNKPPEIIKNILN